MDKGILEQLLESSRHEFLKDRKKDLHNVLKSLAYFSFSPEKDDFQVVYNFFHILKGAGGLNLNRLSDIGSEAQELLYEVEEENNISDNTLVKLIKLIGEVIKIIDERLGSYEDDVNQINQENKIQEISISRGSNKNNTNNSRRKILIVDDENPIRELLRLYFEKEQFEVLEAENGAQAMTIFEEKKPDIIILDIMMPIMDGLEVCQQIRKNDMTPLILLTAKGEDEDRILGLEIGADDYITKPFNPREVVARAKAVLRRTPRNDISSEILNFPDLEINIIEHTVKVKDQSVALTQKERELLWFLASQPGKVLSRSQLLEKVWEYAYSGDTRTVDTHVKRLRKKLGLSDDHDFPWDITTVWGIGYKFELKP